MNEALTHGEFLMVIALVLILAVVIGILRRGP